MKPTEPYQHPGGPIPRAGSALSKEIGRIAKEKFLISYKGRESPIIISANVTRGFIDGYQVEVHYHSSPHTTWTYGFRAQIWVAREDPFDPAWKRRWILGLLESDPPPSWILRYTEDLTCLIDSTE